MKNFFPAFFLITASTFATEPAGVIPPDVFAEDTPVVIVENLNDSTGVGVDLKEWDDHRTFGFRAYAGFGPLGIAAILDSITLRGMPSEPPQRNDELVIGMGLGGNFFPIPGVIIQGSAGGGLRLWSDLGSGSLQKAWHGVLGIERPFPTGYPRHSVASGYAFTTVEAILMSTPSLMADIQALALSSPAVETSASLSISRAPSGSTETFFVRRQDRFGDFSPPDAAMNEVESGTWLGWGISSGFLSFENAFNIEARFSSCSVILTSRPRPRGERDVPAEMAIGTGLLEPVFSVSRVFVLGDFPELHAGAEQSVGGSTLAIEKGQESHFQEGSILLQAYLKRNGEKPPLIPFAGIAAGFREDAVHDKPVYRAKTLSRTVSAIGGADIGIRFDSGFFDSPPGFRIAIDLSAGWLVSSNPFPPPQARITLKAAVLDY